MVSDIVDGRYTIVTKECNHRRLQLGLAEEWGGGGGVISFWRSPQLAVELDRLCGLENLYSAQGRRKGNDRIT